MSTIKYRLCCLGVFVGVVVWLFVCVRAGYCDRLIYSVYNQLSGPCSYCSTPDHSVVYCAKQSVDEGAYGRWIIPDVGINVACYAAVIDGQSITDARDSAALIRRPGAILLADHNYQGFNAIKKCQVGTVAYMERGDSIDAYVCTEVIQGFNQGFELTDLQGDVLDFSSDNGITAYTCHYFSDRITIVHFAPVDQKFLKD